MLKRIITVVIIVIAISLAAFVILLSGFNNDSPVYAGDDAINFSLENMQGEIVTLSEFEGKTIIVNFWASLCKPCINEMPELMKIQKLYKDKVVVVAVNRTLTERTVTAPEEFIKEHQINLEVLFDTEDEVSNLYKVIDMPETFIIDENFKVKERFLGELNADILVNLIEE